MNIQISWLSGIEDKNKRKEIIDNTVLPKLQQFNDIGKQVLEVKTAGSAFGISEAVAGERMPQWVTSPPKDKNTLYFVGHGVARDPKTASRVAADYTKETARVSILAVLESIENNKKNPANGQIAKSILESSDIVNTFVKYDDQQKSYRTFCLLKIDIESIQERLRVLAARENIATPPNFIELLKERYSR